MILEVRVFFFFLGAIFFRFLGVLAYLEVLWAFLVI